MTLEEAHAWLESKDPDACYFTIEWMGTQWIAYDWFGPAGAPDLKYEGTFIGCVEAIQGWMADRASQSENDADK